MIASLILASALLSSPPPQVAARPVIEDRYPERRVAFAGGVTGLADLVYAQPPGFRPLTLDVYLPPSALQPPAGGFPLVLHVHGGGWVSGHSRHAGALKDFPAVLASLAAKGYVVASLNYRLSGEAPFPAALHDVKTAIRWLRTRATGYRIDPARAAVWGGSAGGQLAALAAVTCKVAALDPIGPATLAGVSDCVQGAVAWYGVFDFATLAAQSKSAGSDATVPVDFLGCATGDCTAAAAAASPVTYIDGDDPPMLLITGTADRTVPHLQTIEMAERLKAARVPVATILIPGVGHSFIGATPETTRNATLEALAATFRFIDTTFKGPARR